MNRLESHSNAYNRALEYEYKYITNISHINSMHDAWEYKNVDNGRNLNK